MNYLEALNVLNGHGGITLEHGTELRYNEGNIALSYRDHDIMAWDMDGTLSLSMVSELPLSWSMRRVFMARMNKYLPLGWRVVHLVGNTWNLELHKEWEGTERKIWMFYDGIALKGGDVVSLPF